MTDPQLLAQARKGDAIAIAKLLNNSLQPQGILARVEPMSHGIRIALESPQVPPTHQMEQRIRLGLAKLQPQGISQVTLQGFALGEIEPAWTRELVLAATEVDGEKAVRSPVQAAHPPTEASPDPQQTLNRIERSPAPPRPGRRIARRSSQPLVLKWSDFDPMMLAIIGFIAVYGFLGARNPSYDGPFIWLHYPDLAIHETGHLLFMPFGHFLMVLGGSLTQIAFPAIFTGYFYWTKQYFSSALTLFWTGQNFMDVAVYMADAPYRALPLTTPNPDAHDWWQLFNLMNCMGQAELIAGITHWIGVLLYIASVVAGVYVAYHHQQQEMNQHNRA